MALSSSWNYTSTVTAANVIALALRRLGVYDPAETINSTEESNALQVLNLIVKEWGNQGADIWLRDTTFLMLNAGSTLAVTHGAWYTTASASPLVFGFSNITRLDGAVAAAASSIVVESSTGTLDTNIIFIKQSDNTLHTTTVSGSPSGNTITLATGMRLAAEDGARVYTVTAANRFVGTVLQVQSAAIYQPTEEVFDTTNPQTGTIYNRPSQVRVVGSDEMHSLPSSGRLGRPQVLYHTRKPEYSEFLIDPAGRVSDVDALELVIIYPIMDLDSTSDNLYITPDAFNALAWDLAAQLASEYGIPSVEQQRLWAIAEAKKKDVFDFNKEDASFQIELDDPWRS